jgi:CRP/FNR family transcriptional regulator
MNPLNQIDLFSALSETRRRTLSAKTIQRRYRKGEILFFAGESPRSFMFLLEGTLRLYKTDPKGNEFMLHRFGPVTSIAEMAVLEQHPFPASAQFESDARVLFIDYKVLKEEIEADSSLAFALMGSLSLKIRNLERLIEMNLVLDATARVAKLIVEHPERFKELKKNLIARQLNMTPETFSRSLKKLKAMQLINEPADGIAILNEVGLRSLFEG